MAAFDLYTESRLAKDLQPNKLQVIAMHRDTKVLIGFVAGIILTAATFWFLADSIPDLMHHPGAEADPEHAVHVGLLKTLATYLAIALTIASAVGFSIMLLTVFKLDKERGDTLQQT